MLTVDECRARASAAQQSAQDAPDDTSREAWLDTAYRWRVLARSSEKQEALQAALDAFAASQVSVDDS